MKKLFPLFILIISIFVLFNASAASLNITDFSVKEKTSTSITFTWTKINQATGYKIYSVDENGKLTSVAKTKNNTYTVGNLDPYTRYKFVVKAYKYNDEIKDSIFGEKSNVVSTLTRLETPKPKYKNSSTKAVSITWNKVANADSYIVSYLKSGDSAYTHVKDVKGTYFLAENLEAGQKYYFRIKACKGESRSLISDYIVTYSKPSSVSGKKATSTTSSLQLTWNKGTKYTKYNLSYSTTPDGKKKNLVSNLGKNTYTISKLKPSTTYYIYVTPVITLDGFNLTGKETVLKAKTKDPSITITNGGSVRKGEYIKLNISADGVKASDIKLTSSNTNVIKIEGKKIHTVGTGSATVTAAVGNVKTSKTFNVASAVTSYRAAVYDVKKDCYIFSNRANERCYPGSTTKLITALVAINNCSLDTKMTVGSELGLLEGNSSRCGIQKGERFTLEQLLYGMLLPSGCDAAYTIAVNVARHVTNNYNMSSRDAANYFARMMNNYLKSIGANSSNMLNPHGFPYNNHYTTVHDLVLVAKQVRLSPTLSKITSTYYKSVTALSGRSRNWVTTNSTINPNSGYYNKYSVGMKTGTVNDNYTNIITAAKKDGKEIITVVCGCNGFDERYRATRAMYNAYLY